MPRRLPPWARPDDAPMTVVDDSAARLSKARADLAADRLNTRGTGHMPLDQERAQRELSEGERAYRASQPRTRRWKALDRIDDELSRLQARQGEAFTRLVEAERLLTSAPRDDARTLAQWLANGEKGTRPDPTVYERTRERDAMQLLANAITVEIDRLLEQRVQHVESHRTQMLADARKDLDGLRARYEASVRELASVRDEMLTARDLFAWASTYPEPITSFGHPSALALGLLEPVRRTLQTTSRVDWPNVLTVLDADADALAHSFGPQVQEAIGEGKPRTPEQEAMWQTDPRHKEWASRKLEEARGLAQFGDHQALAAEADDFRPDP